MLLVCPPSDPYWWRRNRSRITSNIAQAKVRKASEVPPRANITKMEKFSGIKGDVEELFRQFEIISAINKYDDACKSIILAAYLEGPALSYYKSISSSCKSYDEYKEKIRIEFAVDVNYTAQFYEYKQSFGEDLLSYYYNLDNLASKADNISEDVFIQQFLKGCNYPNKCRLASQIYENKATLKKTIMQMKNIFGDKQTYNINLPIKLNGVTNNVQPPPQSNSGDGLDKFHTPRTTERVYPRRMQPSRVTEPASPSVPTPPPEQDNSHPYSLRSRQQSTPQRGGNHPKAWQRRR